MVSIDIGQQVRAALALRSPFGDVLASVLLDKAFVGVIRKHQLRTLEEASLLSGEALRLALLPYATAYSYAPISQFKVGAIVEGGSGALYFGANVEFSGVQLGQTVHAEQAAISNAWCQGETSINSVTVNQSPCGHCRQFMNELNQDELLRITHLAPGTVEGSSGGATAVNKTLQQYLPEDFGPMHLGIKGSMLRAGVDHCMTLQGAVTCCVGAPSRDQEETPPPCAAVTSPVVEAAVSALNKSYAPYTKSYSGVAVQLTDNRIVSGSYAENAAYNPTLAPLQAAMVQVILHSKSLDTIQCVALAELETSVVRQYPAVRMILEAINPKITLVHAKV